MVAAYADCFTGAGVFALASRLDVVPQNRLSIIEQVFVEAARGALFCIYSLRYRTPNNLFGRRGASQRRGLSRSVRTNWPKE